MTYIDRNIVDAYAALLKGMSTDNKKKLIEHLSEPVLENESLVEEKFYSSFGSFADDRSAVEIIEGIKQSRKFRVKDLSI